MLCLGLRILCIIWRQVAIRRGDAVKSLPGPTGLRGRKQPLLRFAGVLNKSRRRRISPVRGVGPGLAAIASSELRAGQISDRTGVMEGHMTRADTRTGGFCALSSATSAEPTAVGGALVP